MFDEALHFWLSLGAIGVFASPLPYIKKLYSKLPVALTDKISQVDKFYDSLLSAFHFGLCIYVKHSPIDLNAEENAVKATKAFPCPNLNEYGDFSEEEKEVLTQFFYTVMDAGYKRKHIREP